MIIENSNLEKSAVSFDKDILHANYTLAAYKYYNNLRINNCYSRDLHSHSLDLFLKYYLFDLF